MKWKKETPGSNDFLIFSLNLDKIRDDPSLKKQAVSKGNKINFQVIIITV